MSSSCQGRHGHQESLFLVFIVRVLAFTLRAAAYGELLRYLADRLPDRQFMLLVSYRPTDQLEAFAGEHTAHTVLRLEPMSSDNSTLLHDIMFGSTTRQLPDELRMRIVGHAARQRLFSSPLNHESARALLFARPASCRYSIPPISSTAAPTGPVSAPGTRLGSSTHGFHVGRITMASGDWGHVGVEDAADALIHEAIHCLLLMLDCDRPMLVDDQANLSPMLSEKLHYRRCANCP